ncbi:MULTISPECIES: YhcN/YlaJ family sporulation lipoprotein [Bacillus]|uniref:YhcN/YlaJ family sporulation lipoprotein n=1 Tax=Bacillus TaxID=1386 RepID=UPI00192E004B|nr:MULTISPECIES: YhcN/YlaJ family sporulation lipoprotein [Bacillus]MBL6008298.1 YhcN/YlaJ family sporulation lipoprotein [Bacillus halotolerans]MCK8099657.1 YhcN/YlaJ family sporulation lipoprotein [Bacillus sp. 2CMS4F]MEC1606725.1 YhcN/YlaJ family sporulation lipoprotein [Bacillus halotolerans]
MKRTAVSLCLMTGLLSGCGGAGFNNAEQNAQHQNETRPIHVSDRDEAFNRHDENEQFGYVRYQKEQLDAEQQETPAPDREETAHIISSLTVQLPHIQDAAALVTDQEALVVYKTDSKNRELTADQVKKTAVSVIPRYYHVYISDNPNHMQAIKNYSNLGSSSRDVRDIMSGTIQEMKTSPQGSPVSENENANGETRQDKETNRNDKNAR